MNESRVIPLAAGVLLSVASTAHADIALTAAQQDNLGVQTAVATAAAVPVQVPAVTRVVDPLPWIRLEGDWRAATAASQTTRREAERARRLHAADSSVSGRVVETADAQAAGDDAKRDSLDAERRLTMGAAVTGMDDAARRHLFADLVQGRARLLRLEALHDASPGTGFDGASLDADARPLEWLGRAPQANAGSLTAGYLGVARGLDAAPGEAVEARLNAPGVQRGVRIDDAAVLRWNAATWVYRRHGEDTFERTPVLLLRRLDDGAWLASGVAAGDAVAIAGAQALLAADLRQPAAGEEH